MEFQYSVIIFSKYSSKCKKIFSMLEETGIQLEEYRIKPFCIDNEKIRKRIKQNKQIDISSVPCILSIFSNGGVEKYDDGYAFTWIENLIQSVILPLSVQKQTIPKQEEKLLEEKIEIDEIPKNMEPIREETTSNTTSLDEIPFEEKEESDRYKNPPQPKLLRKDKNSYIQDETIFNDEQPENRFDINNVSKNTVDKKTHTNIKAKAEELAKGREDIDKLFPNPLTKNT